VHERDKIVLEILAELTNQDTLLVSKKKLQLNFYNQFRDSVDFKCLSTMQLGEQSVFFIPASAYS